MKTLALIGLCVSLISAHADAAQSSSPVEYLVVYKTAKIPAGLEASSKTEIQNYFQSQNKKLEATVFGRNALRNLTARKELWIANGTLAVLDKVAAKKLRQDPLVQAVTPLNRYGRLTAMRYGDGPENMRLPELNSKYPTLDGSGMTVGIIDTGIYSQHPDLMGKIAAFRDFVFGEKSPYDDHGHGTFVAGEIAGGFKSGYQIGIAPNSKLVVAKAFSKYGGSEEKNLLLALQWMADPDENSATNDAVDVISSSWNVDADFSKTDPETEPFCIATQNLETLGILSVFSAGNDGPRASSVLPPGACPSTLAVGAIDFKNNLASYSSRGPVRWKTKMNAKPDIVALGTDAYSTSNNGGYVYKSGTSMSTPFVAGAAALLMQAMPNGNLKAIKEKMLSTAKDLGPTGADSGFGYGALDIFSAIEGKP